MIYFLFLLIMAAIFDFCQACDIAADISDTFDTILGPFTFIQRSVLLKCTNYCINVSGREGVNTRGRSRG